MSSERQDQQPPQSSMINRRNAVSHQEITPQFYETFKSETRKPNIFNQPDPHEVNPIYQTTIELEDDCDRTEINEKTDQDNEQPIKPPRQRKTSRSTTASERRLYDEYLQPVSVKSFFEIQNKKLIV